MFDKDTYDKGGNRKSRAVSQTNWTYNKNNELIATDSASFSYDPNGNTQSKAENGESTNYAYNAKDRLAQMNLPDGSTVTYAYDPFGRRIKKQVGSESTYYLYADEGLIGEYSATGDFQRGYGWRPNGVWGTNPLFMVEDGENYYYHNDHLGTPQKMTDTDGDVVWEATYEAFGKAMVDPESTVVNNLRFPGQYWDEESGLHYNWNRYYDPGTGRYVEADPIGLKGGINLYSYVHSQPISLIDPEGLLACAGCHGGGAWDNDIPSDPGKVAALIMKYWCESQGNSSLAYNLAFNDRQGPRTLSQPGFDLSLRDAEHYFLAYNHPQLALVIPGYSVFKKLGFDYPRASKPTLSEVYWGQRGALDGLRGIKPSQKDCACNGKK